MIATGLLSPHRRIIRPWRQHSVAQYVPVNCEITLDCVVINDTDEYKIYMDARRVLRQQLELEATLTDAAGETPRSSHSPSPQHEPVAGDVMDFPHTEPSTTRPPTPTPPSPRLDPSSPPPPPGRNVMAFRTQSHLQVVLHHQHP